MSGKGMLSRTGCWVTVPAGPDSMGCCCWGASTAGMLRTWSSSLRGCGIEEMECWGWHDSDD